MAISYDQWKKSYESMDDSQKQQYNDAIKNKGDDYIGNQYMKQYNNASKPINNENTANNSQNGMSVEGYEGNKSPSGFYTGNSGWEKEQNRKKLESSAQGVEVTQNEDDINKSISKAQEDMKNGNLDLDTSKYNKDLDLSKFNEAPGEISVKEGTAQQTGRPDYQANTQARLDEMKRNLDQYFADSPRMFSDRETFNRVFEYDSRDSEAQKQLLDSYWKRKQDMDVASNYTNGATIIEGMKNAKITSSQLNLIKEYNPEAYREWQQKQLDDINLRIANLATPADPTDTAELFNSLVNKLGLDPGDPYQIYDNWYSMCERLGVFSDSEKLKSYQSQLDANHSKMESIMSRYSASTGGTVSDALAAARMSKALAPYQQREVDLQNSYTTLLNGRNSNLAVANQSANALAMQAAEDQRIWNQRLQGLGFAMQTAAFRTPEQQAQLQLQTAQIQNDMNLLYQAKANDLNLYNQYATTKLQNQLQQELTDLSVEDEAQLKANLNNVLSQYYSQWGDIIKRPQAEVVEDVLAYAQKNGVSVAEALRKNFIEPLQSKQEYKNKIASNYAAPTSANSVGYSKITINGKDYLVSNGKIIDPASIGIGGGTGVDAKPFNIVAPEIMESGVDAFLVGKEKGQTYGQCGKLANDFLVSIGATAADNRYFGNEDINTRAKRCNSQTAAKGSIAVFNYNHLSDDGINHGHVAVVTQTYADGSFDVIEANYPSGEKINTRHIEANDAACLGFINPSLGQSKTQGYNAKDPYSGVSRYTSTGKEINAGGWVTSLENSFDRWEKLTDTQRKDIYSAYGVDVGELNEMRERYMNYVETKQMVDSLLDVKARATKLKEWAEKDTNKDLKGWMDIDIANQGYAGFWQDLFTKDTTISSIQEGKALYDNLMSNAGFQKYLDMKDKGAQFGIMTDSEWNKVDSSVAPLKREQKDALFINNLDYMIKGYDEVLMQLGYDFAEGTKPETADQVQITENNGAGDGVIMTMQDANGKVWYSYDGGKTRQ